MIFISHIISSFFGLGYLPKMPGTWGTLGAFFFYFLFPASSYFHLLLMTVSTFFVGWFTSHICLRQNDFNDSDPSWIVIDEVAGYLFTLLLVATFIPLYTHVQLIGFIFFRVFDILKPWPISWADHYFSKFKKTAAFGIMLDDMLAAIFAALFTLFSLRVFG